MPIEFKRLTPEESAKLSQALRRNGETGEALRMDALTTGWIPGADELETESLIDAIRSVPCHYAALAEEPRFAVLRRLIMQSGETIVRGEYMDAEDARPVDIDMGAVATSWWDLPLPACPDCGGKIVWAEAGYVPGARQCTACESLFTIGSWDAKERYESLVAAWQFARNRTKDDVLELDQARAAQCGLPVMAALFALMGRLESANGPITPREMISELAPILQLARGEAQKRARHRDIDIQIPGIASIPAGDVL